MLKLAFVAAVEGNRHVYHSQPRFRSGWWLVGVAVGGAVLWGGYSHRWPWTGINGRTATLWDWLNLVMLPIAFALLPVWFDPTKRMTRTHRRIAIGALVAFVGLVAAGYLIPWGWTGFVGTTLWKWLELMLVPAAVALTPILPELRARWTRTDTLVGAGLLGTFVVVAVLGYLDDWGWTGFHGNTLWDWLHLLLLPLVVPMVILPVLHPRPTHSIAAAERSVGAPPETLLPVAPDDAGDPGDPGDTG